jgi:hypothetical protein
MKVKHTQNGNIKLTVTEDQAKVINWCLTYAAGKSEDGYFARHETAAARAMADELDSARLF